MPLTPILTLIFSASLKQGKTPDDWKEANVSPIFKKGDKLTQLAKYRPVSLTSVCSFLEHIIHSHLLSLSSRCLVMVVWLFLMVLSMHGLEHIVTTNVVPHMDKYNLLCDLQHGFRSKPYCETQLITLVEDLMHNSIAGNQTGRVLLDFSNAFDKVSHQKLLLKLHRYGIRGHTLKWIQAFLSDRTQTVVIDNEKSTTVSVTFGVPQVYVLSPLLFIIHINDLPDETRSRVRLFVDYTAIYLAVSGLEDSQILQQDIDHLHQ